MQQSDVPRHSEIGEREQAQQSPASKRVSDHLANERTFLAWIRTGLATITFGFVVARFGLLLQELGLKTKTFLSLPVHFSLLMGVALTFLGVAIIIAALVNFLHVRRAIDAEQYYPATGFAILLTVLAGCIGFLLAIYLLFTA